jgi:serine protease Do
MKLNASSLFATSILSICLSIFPVFTSHAEDNGLEVAKQFSTAFEKIADSVSPSVVSITASSKPKAIGQRFGKRGQELPEQLAPFKDFFGDDFLDQFKGDEGSPASGLGTGVIFDKEGRILTNNHVIKGADEVTVRIQNDSKPYKAKIIGTDPRTDIAVIQIQAKDLVPARLGDSEHLRIGEWVVAIGNPFGLTNSITAGIVSAKGRSISGGGQFEDFIQTDAAINPGNSGGPLVNLNGEVVGINSAIFSRSGGYMGIGFAIPIDMAKNVIKSLISDGKVTRGWLGVIIQPLTEDLSSSFGFNGTEGSLVAQVDKEGPAAKAGIKTEDIIVKIDGKVVKNITELRNLVAGIAPKTKIPVTIFRDGKEKEISVTIGELPDKANKAPEEEEDTLGLGLTVEELTPDLARRLHSQHEEGVVVSKVVPGGAADQAGIDVRDIIISVNGKKITTPAEFEKKATKSALTKGIRLVIESQGLDRFVFLKSGESEE